MVAGKGVVWDGGAPEAVPPHWEGGPAAVCKKVRVECFAVAEGVAESPEVLPVF